MGGMLDAYAEQQRQAEMKSAVFMAELELEYQLSLLRRTTDMCFRKCATTWQETELSKGEGQCTDRCVSKFFQMAKLVQERKADIDQKVQEEHAAEMELQARMRGEMM
jgi:mitochondrial import inner membrane translocase subunit TIM10